MRAGWIISAVGHVGVALIAKATWQVAPVEVPAMGNVVPIEIVNIAPESNVRALAIPVPEDAVETAEETVQEPTPEAAPSPEPTPQPRRENDRFDLASVARLANQDQEAGRQRREGAPADRNQDAVGLSSGEVASMQDRVRAITQRHMLRCWRMPADLPEPERLVITVEWEVDRNGNLRGQPRVTQPANYRYDRYMTVAAEAALRAVRQCDPYPFADDPLVGEHYEIWRNGTFTFRPRT